MKIYRRKIYASRYTDLANEYNRLRGIQRKYKEDSAEKRQQMLTDVKAEINELLEKIKAILGSYVDELNLTFDGGFEYMNNFYTIRITIDRRTQQNRFNGSIDWSYNIRYKTVTDANGVSSYKLVKKYCIYSNISETSIENLPVLNKSLQAVEILNHFDWDSLMAETERNHIKEENYRIEEPEELTGFNFWNYLGELRRAAIEEISSHIGTKTAYKDEDGNDMLVLRETPKAFYVAEIFDDDFDDNGNLLLDKDDCHRINKEKFVKTLKMPLKEVKY